MSQRSCSVFSRCPSTMWRGLIPLSVQGWENKLIVKVIIHSLYSSIRPYNPIHPLFISSIYLSNRPTIHKLFIHPMHPSIYLSNQPTIHPRTHLFIHPIQSHTSTHTIHTFIHLLPVPSPTETLRSLSAFMKTSTLWIFYKKKKTYKIVRTGFMKIEYIFQPNDNNQTTIPVI